MAADAFVPPVSRGGCAVRDPLRDDTTSRCDGLVIGRLKHRADFVRTAKGRRWHGAPFTLQAAPSEAGPEPRDSVPCDPAPMSEASVRFGFTLTRKVGNAVVRNRARRRLREAVRLAHDLPVRPGHDYVLVGRIDAIRLPFETLTSDLSRALDAVHARGPTKARGAGETRGATGHAGSPDGRGREKPRRTP